MLRHFKCPLSFIFPHQNSVCTAPFPHTLYIPCPLHSSWFDCSKIFWAQYRSWLPSPQVMITLSTGHDCPLHRSWLPSPQVMITLSILHSAEVTCYLVPLRPSCTQFSIKVRLCLPSRREIMFHTHTKQEEKIFYLICFYLCVFGSQTGWHRALDRMAGDTSSLQFLLMLPMDGISICYSYVLYVQITGICLSIKGFIAYVDDTILPFIKFARHRQMLLMFSVYLKSPRRRLTKPLCHRW